MKQKIIIFFIVCSPIITSIFALQVGSIRLDVLDSLKEIWDFLIFHKELNSESSILWETRIPRILLALIIGASLAGSGAIMQNIFKNPLIDPFLLGISSGAALGCALSIGVFKHINLTILAFLGAITSSLIILSLGKLNNIALILSGVAISAFLSAITSLIHFFVPPLESQAITIWLFGSLSLSSWSDVYLLFIGFVIAFIPLFLFIKEINILSLRESEAISLGVNVWRVKLVCMLCVSLICALCVSVSGVIGWIGLIVPHIVRFLVGVNMKILLVCAMLLGSSILLLSDCVARGVSHFDLPIGSINAILFSPLFLIILLRYIKNARD